MKIARTCRNVLTVATLFALSLPATAGAASITVCLGAVPASYGCDNQASSLGLAAAAVNAEPELDTLYLAPGEHASAGVTFTSPVRIVGVSADRDAVRVTGAPGLAQGLLRFEALPASVSRVAIEVTGAGDGIHVEPSAQSARAFALLASTVSAPTGTAVRADASAHVDDSTLEAQQALSLNAYRSVGFEITGSELTATSTAVSASAFRAGDVRLSIDHTRVRYGSTGLLTFNRVNAWNASDVGVDLSSRVTNSSFERTGPAGSGNAFMVWERVDGKGTDLETRTTLDLEHVTVAGSHDDLFFLQLEPGPSTGPAYTAGTLRRLDVRLRAVNVLATSNQLVDAICGVIGEQQLMTFTAERSAIDESAPRDANIECMPHLTYEWLDNIDPATVEVVDAAGGDLRPTSDSTLVDAAGCIASPTTRGTDLAGGARLVDGPTPVPCDPAADIGAWEYQRARPAVTVTQAPNAPVLTGAAVQLVATAVDPDPGEGAGMTTEWTLPGGATVSGTTATFSAPATPGTYTATFTATDGIGERGTATVTIMVVAPAPPTPPAPPVPGAPPVQTVTVEVPVTDTTAPVVRVRLAATSAPAIRGGRSLRANVTSSEPALLTCRLTARIRAGGLAQSIALGTSTAPAWTGRSTVQLTPTRAGARAAGALLSLRGARLLAVSATCTARDSAGNDTRSVSVAALRTNRLRAVRSPR